MNNIELIEFFILICNSALLSVYFVYFVNQEKGENYVCVNAQRYAFPENRCVDSGCQG